MEQTSCALRCKKYVVLKIRVLAFVVHNLVTSSTAGVKKMCEILYCSAAGDIMSKRSVPLSGFWRSEVSGWTLCVTGLGKTLHITDDVPE
ncbi:hypothetical protein Tco_0202887 [Tanacetum coccineum]